MDKDKIRVKLMELGFSPAIKGFENIVKSVCIIDNDPSAAHSIVSDVYYTIAKESNTSVGVVERRVRTSITSASVANAEAIQDFIKLPPSSSDGTYKASDFLVAFWMAMKRE